MVKKRELLAPAGTPEALAAAVNEGADAVYLGLKTFNARLRSNNFTYAQYEAAVKTLHKNKRKIYVTVNTVWTEREADRLYQFLKYIAHSGANGIIVQDFGTLNLARTHFPNLTVHASTQMNIASSKGCNVLSKNGVSRVVLARELSFEEIQEIRAHTTVELEVFVHGALCVSASGLCLFSSYLGGKSANRGMCTQACRRSYTPGESEAKYYFSPLDLELIEKLPNLVGAGVDAFKIEGRMKSADYTGIAVAAYRMVLDAIDEGNEETLRTVTGKATALLRGDFARAKTIFHYNGDLPASYLRAEVEGGTGIRLGRIARFHGTAPRRALIENAPFIPQTGDSIRLHRADDTHRASHKITHIEQHDGGGAAFWCDVPDGFTAGDAVYLTQTRATSRRYPSLLPKNLSGFRLFPGRDKAPHPLFNFKNHLSMHEGISVSVTHIEDLYMVQSIRPSHVILPLDTANAKRLIETNGPLPFKPYEMILSFNPFFNEKLDALLTPYIAPLVEAGYNQYIINNLGQFSLFRNIPQQLHFIAGPYLYTFNRCALNFLASLGSDYHVEGVVSPYENSRRNLESSFDKKNRAYSIITVFAYPALFRIQSPRLRELYSFETFSGKNGETFVLTHHADESIVTPHAPFSIVDKIPFLQTAGFKHFIVDFGPRQLQKKTYKEVMNAALSGRPLGDISRFNWKNGFYEASSAKSKGVS